MLVVPHASYTSACYIIRMLVGPYASCTTCSLCRMLSIVVPPAAVILIGPPTYVVPFRVCLLRPAVTVQLSNRACGHDGQGGGPRLCAVIV